MKIYDIKILKSVTGKKYIKFFFKTFRRRKEEEIETFKRNIQFIVNRKISDEEMQKYNDEKLFISKLKLIKIMENSVGKCKTILYKIDEIWFYKIENLLDENVHFKDKNILLKRDFFINEKYIKYIIIKIDMEGYYGNISS